MSKLIVNHGGDGINNNVRLIDDHSMRRVGGVHSAHGAKHGPIRAVILVLARIFHDQTCADTNEPDGAVHVRQKETFGGKQLTVPLTDSAYLQPQYSQRYVQEA